ncbi:MAG: hypothetical protein MUC65_04505, partial [Pontiellaceae bacterium]|nr:hypothetical protein [Pontiellaceae bacterium]
SCRIYSKAKNAERAFFKKSFYAEIILLMYSCVDECGSGIPVCSAQAGTSAPRWRKLGIFTAKELKDRKKVQKAERYSYPNTLRSSNKQKAPNKKRNSARVYSMDSVGAD